MLMTVRSVCENCGLLTTLLVEQSDNPNQRQVSQDDKVSCSRVSGDDHGGAA